MGGPSFHTRLYWKSLSLVSVDPVTDLPSTMMLPRSCAYRSMRTRRFSSRVLSESAFTYCR